MLCSRVSYDEYNVQGMKRSLITGSEVGLKSQLSGLPFRAQPVSLHSTELTDVAAHSIDIADGQKNWSGTTPAYCIPR
jgi:hypothetical protein